MTERLDATTLRKAAELIRSWERNRMPFRDAPKSPEEIARELDLLASIHEEREVAELDCYLRQLVKEGRVDA